MPKTYATTKKAKLEAYITNLPTDLLPPINILSESVQLTPSSLHAALREWAGNTTIVAKVDREWVRQGFCPDCTVDLEPHEPKHAYRLWHYSILRTEYDGILVYADCVKCRRQFVSRNNGDWEKAAPPRSDKNRLTHRSEL
jgi:hypothetical protein